MLAGVSLDQVSRVERGENAGIWYVAALLATLHQKGAIDGQERALIDALVRDGREVIESGVLKDRLSVHPAPAQKKRKNSA